jgi:hypothetical protein
MIEPVVTALTGYTDEVVQIELDTRSAMDVRAQAHAGYAAARVGVLDAMFDPVRSPAAVGRLHDALAVAAHAEQALTALSDRRRQADAAMIAALHAHTPTAWTDGGARVAALDPRQLSRGTDPFALAGWASGLPDTPEGDAALRWRIQDLPPQTIEALLAAHPYLATRLMRPDPDALAAACPELAAAVAITDRDARLAAVTTAFATMTPAVRSAIAQTHPWAVGDLDGAPLAVRAAANRIAIRAAIPDAERRIAELDRQIAEAGAGAASFENAQRALGPLVEERQTLLDRIPWCEGLLAVPVGEIVYTTDKDNPASVPAWHQVVLFDPDAGRFGEVIGPLNAANVAVQVGGTGTNLAKMGDEAERAWNLVDAVPGSLAVITYLGGPMPQNAIVNSPLRTYADAIAPHLAGFANGVRASIDVPLTVAGHSYGGLVVGTAEADGMVADRVLYIAASGSAVRDSHEYAAPDTPRYSMTAPGDFIEPVQASGAHGRDPDEVTGTVRIETGRFHPAAPEDGPERLVQGPAAHSEVFDNRTGAFVNIHAVMTGGEVSLWTPPVDTWEVNEAGRLAYTGREFPMDDPDFVPPTQDVP